MKKTVMRLSGNQVLDEIKKGNEVFAVDLIDRKEIKNCNCEITVSSLLEGIEKANNDKTGRYIFYRIGEVEQ